MGNMTTGSGLVEDFDYTIKDAVFAFDARIGDGEIALLQLSGINSETTSEESIWLKAGKTWDVSRDGGTIEYTGTGRNAAVNRNTQYGQWIDSFMACDGASRLVDERDMDAFKAESWVGLTLTVHRGTREYNIDGNKVEGTVWSVTGIVGVTTDEQVTGQASVAEIPVAVEAKLIKLAAGSKTFESFVDLAYDQIEGLTGSSFEDHVTDDTAAGFYALHAG